MARLFALAFQWILRKLGLLIVIVAILVGASLLKSEWREHREIQACARHPSGETARRIRP